MTTDLSQRYGSPSRVQRWVVISIGVIATVVGLAWLLWAAAFYSDPPVKSTLVGFDVVSDHETEATVQVKLGEDVEATCRLRALAEDKTAVGELAFTPVAGDNDVVIRTERRATSVEKLGCTAPGQKRPR